MAFLVRWRITDSMIWSPMVKAGLSAVIGSWKIMAMRSPRSADQASVESPSRSRPSKRTRPSVTETGGVCSRPISASAVTDLPQPDSLTMHKVSPGMIEKLTPSTRF